jgi:arsenate reductase-like glutaredoxin family protein
LDANGIEPATTVPASQKLGKTDAARMARAASRVIVAKGKKVTEFKPGGKATADLLAAMLGPTGNLRAPTARAGKTVLVGFNEDAYKDALL